MDNKDFISGLLAVRNCAGFTAFHGFIQSKLDGIRDMLESDQRLTDFNQICLLRGEAAAYRSILSMFDREIDLIKKQQDGDETALNLLNHGGSGPRQI